MTSAFQADEHRPEARYLTFSLGTEEYGLDVLKVQEIIGLPHITPVPRTPDFLSGLINLRGRVVPVVDLRLKLGMPPVPPTAKTCIIIVESRNRHTGLIVDRVKDVWGVDSDNVDPPPALGTEIRTDYILGMGKSEEGLKILLDVDRVLTQEDDSVLEEALES